MAIKTIAGSGNSTLLGSMGRWKGKDIWVTQTTTKCRIEGHALEVLHHFGDNGNKHYCPTKLLLCPYCGGIADEPEPYGCNKWGEI